MVVCALYSCQQYYRMRMGNKETCQAHTSSSNAGYDRLKSFPSTESGPIEANLKEDTKHKQFECSPPKFYIILVPSPEASVSTTEKTKQELEKKFGKDARVFQIKSLEDTKTTDLSGEWQVEKIHQEILLLLDHSFKLQDLTKAEADKYLKVPIHIFGWDRVSLMDHIKGPNLIAATFNCVFNIKTLSVASVVDNPDTAQDNYIGYFSGDEDKIISDYIAFLRKQQD